MDGRGGQAYICVSTGSERARRRQTRDETSSNNYYTVRDDDREPTSSSNNKKLVSRQARQVVSGCFLCTWCWDGHLPCDCVSAVRCLCYNRRWLVPGTANELLAGRQPPRSPSLPCFVLVRICYLKWRQSAAAEAAAADHLNGTLCTSYVASIHLIPSCSIHAIPFTGFDGVWPGEKIHHHSRRLCGNLGVTQRTQDVLYFDRILHPHLGVFIIIIVVHNICPGWGSTPAST